MQRKYLIATRGLKGKELDAAMEKIPFSEREKTARIVRAAVAIKEQHTIRNEIVYDLGEKMHRGWREAREVDAESGLKKTRHKIYNGQSWDIANLDFAELPVEEQYRN